MQENRTKDIWPQDNGERYKVIYAGSTDERNGVWTVLDRKLADWVIEIRRVNRIMVVKAIWRDLVFNLVPMDKRSLG